MKTKLLATLMLSLCTLGPVACAPAAEEDPPVGGSDDAVKVDQVLPEGATELMTDVRVTDPRLLEAGIRTWSFYFVHDGRSDLQGLVGFALDANGDIALSATVGSTREALRAGQAALGVVKYDANGPAADQTLAPGVEAALQQNLHEVAALLRRAEAPLLPPALTCVGTVAGLLAGGIVAAMTATVTVGVTTVLSAAQLAVLTVGAAAVVGSSGYVASRIAEGTGGLRAVGVRLVEGVGANLASCRDAF